MFGFSAISETPIATLPGATIAMARGTIQGSSNLSGHIKLTGVIPSKGTIQGAAFLHGVGFTNAVETLGTRNQLFDFSVDALASLLWQDDVAPTLTALVKLKQKWYDLNFTQFWQNWFTDVFDLRTANFFGCTVWSIILKMPLNIQYPQATENNWGFGPYQVNFDRGNFKPESYTVIPLTPLQARTLLQLRYYKLITRTAIPDINKNLARIFAPFGAVWAIDNLNMTMDYVWDFDMPDTMQFIIALYDLLPHGAGVKVRYWRNGQSAGHIQGSSTLTGRNNKTHGTIAGAATLKGVGAQF